MATLRYEFTQQAVARGLRGGQIDVPAEDPLASGVLAVTATATAAESQPTAPASATGDAFVRLLAIDAAVYVDMAASPDPSSEPRTLLVPGQPARFRIVPGHRLAAVLAADVPAAAGGGAGGGGGDASAANQTALLAALGGDGSAPPALAGSGVRGWLRGVHERLGTTLTIARPPLTFANAAGSPFTLTAAWQKVATTTTATKGLRLAALASAATFDIEWAAVASGAAAPTDASGEPIMAGEDFAAGLPIGDIYLRSASGQKAVVRMGA